MTSNSRLVECLDCGNRWESTADNPRCSKSDCGRSRNVEPVADEDDEPVEDDRDDEPVEDDRDDEDDEYTGGYTPKFEAQTVRKEAEKRNPSSSSTNTDDEDDEDDEQDDDEDEPTGEGDLPEIDPEQIETALDSSFGMIAVRRGEHWRLDEDEVRQLAQVWTPVLNNYAPLIMREYTEIGAAVVVSVTILGPRLAEDRERAKTEEAEAIDDEAGAGTIREERTEPVEHVDEQDDEQDDRITAENDTELGGYAEV